MLPVTSLLHVLLYCTISYCLRLTLCQSYPVASHAQVLEGVAVVR